MHILLLPSWYPLNESDLNGSFFREQAHALARSGEKVGVIVPQFRSLRLGKKAVFGRYDEECWQDGEVTTYFKHNVAWLPRVPHIDAKRWTKAGLALFERYIKEQGKPDIIHVHSLTHAGELAAIIKQKYGIPYCVTEHSSVYARGLLKNWQIPALKQAEQSASKLLAVSKSLADILKTTLNGEAWSVFPNLLDNLFVEPTEPVARKTQICAVGFLRPNKGFDLLIKAFATVLKRYPQYHLMIGGNGPEKANLAALVEQLGLQQNVTLLGELSRLQVRELMRESELYVVSSHVETFGIVAIEALSQGTPVVATLCGGPESIVTPADGVLVPTNDENALAQGILTVLDNAAQFDHEAIKARCIATYSEPAFVQRLKAIYHDILKK